MAHRVIRRQDVGPLGAIGLILAVTAAWWCFALWSVPSAPAWLERARSVCFNITESGLPDTKGWLLLLGQPPIMVGFLLVGWRDAVRDSMRHLLGSPPGRFVAGTTLALGVAGAGLAAARIAAAHVPGASWGVEGPAAPTHPRLDRPWPVARGLVDQWGEPFAVSRLAGRSALVTFAFGHCETLCPVVVAQALAARKALDDDGGLDHRMSVVVLTLDPWRDTPGRLATLLERWGLDTRHDFVVGGAVESVQAALDAWAVTRTRDRRTGDIVHPAVIYLVEPDGTVAFSSAGGVRHLVSLAKRLR